jgi:hypothetical protein
VAGAEHAQAAAGSVAAVARKPQEDGGELDGCFFGCFWWWWWLSRASEECWRQKEGGARGRPHGVATDINRTDAPLPSTPQVENTSTERLPKAARQAAGQIQMNA